MRDFRAGQQDREFVAAEARAGVAGADLGLGAPRDFLERLVAGQVSEAIVDLLEVIDVDHEAGQRLAGAFGARQLLAQPVVEIAPVVPAGEEIGDAAAHQARAIDRVFQADRHDHAQVREKIRSQVQVNRCGSRLPKAMTPMARLSRGSGISAMLPCVSAGETSSSCSAAS